MAQLSPEELKNMTPEQIAELQKQNCIFCHIIQGKVPSKKVYEDSVCLAILDINPANPGHILLMPKNHAVVMPQLSDEEIGHLGIVAKKLSHACLKALQVQGVNIFAANGAVAGQKAPHFMMHVIPRKEGDGIAVFQIPEKKINPQEQLKLQELVVKRLNSILGIKTEEKKVEKTIEKGELEKEAEIKKETAKERVNEEKKFENKSESKKEDNGKIDLDKIAGIFLK